jgi:hypothetical protein
MYKKIVTIIFSFLLLSYAENAVANNVTICSGSTATLTAVGSGIINWYDAAVAGNLLGTGSTFTTPVLNSTITYYSEDNTGTRTANTVTVNLLPTATIIASSLTQCSGFASNFNAASLCSGNKALNFSGSSSGSRATLTKIVDNITMEIWARRSETVNAGRQILFFNGHTGNGGYGISMKSDGVLEILVSGISYLVAANRKLLPGIWQHIAIVRNNGVWSLYLNGVQYSVSSNTTTPRSPSVAGGNQLSVGYDQGGAQRFIGELDEAKFWTNVRTTAEIQADMKACSTAPATGLLAYWNFNEGTGTSAADASGNGYTLNLNGTSWNNSGAPTGGTYAWDFGGGNTDAFAGATYTFVTGGSKPVTVTVTDSKGCSASVTQSITLNQSPTPSISGTTTACASVSLTADGGTSYAWNGGSSTSTAVNNFSASGNYTVTVTDVIGCTATATQAITVNANPSAPAGEALPEINSYGATLNNPTACVFDASGNLYVANGYMGTIKKISPDGTVITDFVTGLGSLAGMAIDVTGNSLYVTDQDYGAIKKINLNTAAVTSFYSGLSYPESIAVDGSGNIYVADIDYQVIKKISSGGGSAIDFITGLNYPTGMAFDASGNLYVSDLYDNMIRKYNSSGVWLSDFATGISGPAGISFSSSGLLYVASRYGNNIKTVSTVGEIKTYLSNISNPQALAFNSSGNLFTIYNYNSVGKIVDPPLNNTIVMDEGSVTLVASPNTGETIDWYSSLSAGTVLLSGSKNYITPTVATTTNYYALARNTTTGCVSAVRTPVAITVQTGKLIKTGGRTTGDAGKISKNGAVGVGGVSRNGKILN